MTPPLVLLHPLGADHSFWAPIVPLLGDRDVVVPDLAGHGRAPRLAAGATLDDVTGLVADQLAERGIARCDVAGISLGGLVAQRLAVRHRPLVRRLVLADTLARYPEPMRALWRDRATLARRQGTAALVNATVAVWFTEAFAAADGPEVRRVAEVLGRMSGEDYARTCELLRDVDLSADVGKIDVPTLVVCGELETRPFLDAAAAFREEIPDARLLWLEGRHAAVLERPVGFARAVADFLDGGAR